MWSLAAPYYYDKRYLQNSMEDALDMASQHGIVLPPGIAILDNVRFFPLVYDNFETGDFSHTKWRQEGDGAPWRVTTEGALERHSAFVSATPDMPNGVSTLSLTVDV